MELWIAFTIGLLGSMHCVGMCGPIAFALPLNRDKVSSIYAGTLIYNLGRLSTYFSLGLVLGWLGFGFSLAGFQQSLSILIGLSMLFVILFSLLKRQSLVPKFWLSNIGKLNGVLAAQFKTKSYKNLLSIGLLNGLLPCGLVYFGLAGATAMAEPLGGALFMLFFGLGTMPLMLAVSLFGAQIKSSLKQKVRKFSPVILFLFASLFILRGLNLGIPYISPDLETNQEISNTCYQPEE